MLRNDGIEVDVISPGLFMVAKKWPRLVEDSGALEVVSPAGRGHYAILEAGKAIEKKQSL